MDVTLARCLRSGEHRTSTPASFIQIFQVRVSGVRQMVPISNLKSPQSSCWHETANCCNVLEQFYPITITIFNGGNSISSQLVALTQNCSPIFLIYGINTSKLDIYLLHLMFPLKSRTQRPFTSFEQVCCEIPHSEKCLNFIF